MSFSTLKKLTCLTGCIILTFRFSIAQNFPYQVNPPFDQSNNIRAYLNRVAGEITQRSLGGIQTLDDWQGQIGRRKQELIEMLGLQDHLTSEERLPPPVTKTDTIEQDGYRIIKLYYESLPNLFVPANLYIPDRIIGPAPAILYVCGHAHTQKHHYQAHARSFAKNGFVCLIIETIQRGEVKGEHLGEESLGWFHWYSRGYHPGGVEVWNGIRGIDLLCQLSEVNSSQIGVTGISGGGSQSWYLPSIDSRIKAAAAVDGAASLEGQICQRTIDDHCDCMMPINSFGIDFSDIGALIAPRPFLIAQTTGDGYYSIEAVQTVFDHLQPIYELHNKPSNLMMVTAPGGHGYGDHEEFRAQILSFFRKELMGKELNPENIDTSKPLSDDELRVYLEGPPGDDITTTIQDRFVKMAKIPEIRSIEDLAQYRTQIKDFLLQNTFRHFPANSVPLDIRLEFQDRDFAEYGRQNYSFVSEEGWRLPFSLRRRQPAELEKPLVLVLVNPDGERYQHYALTSGLDDQFNIAYLETRGVGETGWAPSLQWHVRRAAAWTGRTIASMRVYDVLRCLNALEQIAGINDQEIYLAAEGEMVVVAAYAALLNSKIRGLILKNPPATQDTPSQPDGRGEALEMLNCLRVTDLPQVVGLSFPAKIIALGQLPETYQWVQALYKKLDVGSSFIMVDKLSEWHPND